MKTTIYKVRRSFLAEEEYVTREQAFERTWRSCEPVRIDIPDRFEPKEDKEGRVFLKHDENRYLLREVLGINRFGQPALIFDDQQFNAPHFITLPVAGEQKERFLK